MIRQFSSTPRPVRRVRSRREPEHPTLTKLSEQAIACVVSAFGYHFIVAFLQVIRHGVRYQRALRSRRCSDKEEPTLRSNSPVLRSMEMRATLSETSRIGSASGTATTVSSSRRCRVMVEEQPSQSQKYSLCIWKYNDLATGLTGNGSNMILAMIVWLRHLLGWLVSAFHSRQDLILENLALRQQLLVLHAQRPRRRFTAAHKLFWVLLRNAWTGWKRPLILVTPRTVVDWHRAGFRLYWKWISRARARGGRKPVSKEIRSLIFQMVAENPTWGAPRIHGELLKLGFKVSEPTVSRWVRKAPRPADPAKRWLTFLRNHREAIAAMDFFTVPTLTFGVLYGFFVIAHDRRRILNCNVTRNPQAVWVALQLRETWEEGEEPQRFLLFDRDSKFGADVVSTVKAMGCQPLRTAFRSPWQNSVAERWVGSVRRDLLDHVIVLNQRHLRRLLNEYVRYCHADRTHLGLGKDTPVGRIAESTPPSGGKVISMPRLGGLHHRYIAAA